MILAASLPGKTENHRINSEKTGQGVEVYSTPAVACAYEQNTHFSTSKGVGFPSLSTWLPFPKYPISFFQPKFEQLGGNEAVAIVAPVSGQVLSSSKPFPRTQHFPCSASSPCSSCKQFPIAVAWQSPQLMSYPKDKCWYGAESGETPFPMQFRAINCLNHTEPFGRTGLYIFVGLGWGLGLVFFFWGVLLGLVSSVLKPHKGILASGQTQ